MSLLNNMKITPVILAGGVGERLWPLSRVNYPKQFISFAENEKTLLQECVVRVSDEDSFFNPVIVGSDEHRFITAEQVRLAGVKPQSIILEPARKNTAIAIALAAINIIKNKADDDIMLVMPSDHIIRNRDAFYQAIKIGAAQARDGKLVTFGIKAKTPETGYGYIKSGSKIADGCFSVEKFVEKPDVQTAKNYVESGEYTWNSGIFLFKASKYLAELEKFEAGVFRAANVSMSSASVDADFIRPEEESFMDSPSISIDYAVMEKTADAVVVPVDMDWSDLGSWNSIWEIAEKDSLNNHLEGRVVIEDVENTLIRSDKNLIGAVGVKDLVIISSDNAIMVGNRDKMQDIKKLLDKMKKAKMPEVESHSYSNRPWGSFQSIDVGVGYQVKRLTIKAGAKISLQKHAKRSEHWIVVNGRATVINGDKEITLNENESTYIPAGTIHRLENKELDRELNIIEVQTGSYLGEDDIERFDDVYGRADK